MSVTAIVLLTFSAAIHAGWNLLSKRQRPSAAFFLVTSAVGALLFLPYLLLRWSELESFPVAVWVLVTVTGGFLAVYYWSLAGAYRAGDMSIAYPIARSSPVIVVTIATVGLGQRDEVGTLCIVGAVLVVAGCYLVPMRRFSDLRLRHFLNATCLLALVAAFGTAGYSMIDDAALAQLRTAMTGPSSTVTATLLYACVEAVSASIWLGAVVAVDRRERRRLRHVVHSGAAAAVAVGIAIFVAYALVLAAMAFVSNVSYVVAFRQLSIPMGATLGILALREPACPPKLVGVAIMSVGLFLVAIG